MLVYQFILTKPVNDTLRHTLHLFKCFLKENKNNGPAKQQVLQNMHSINTFSFLGLKKMAWEEDHRPTD